MNDDRIDGHNLVVVLRARDNRTKSYYLLYGFIIPINFILRYAIDALSIHYREFQRCRCIAKGNVLDAHIINVTL